MTRASGPGALSWLTRLVDPHYQGQADQMLQLLARYDDEQLAVITDFVGTIAGASFPVTSEERRAGP